MGQRKRATAATVGLGLLAVALTGCSGRGEATRVVAGTVGPEDIVRRAADVLARSGSSKVTTMMEMASGGTQVAVKGVGGFDYRKRHGELEVTLPKDAAGAVEHKPITELVTPQALYMKNRGAGVPADKWVRVDTTQVSDGNLMTGGATDPLTAAELLRGARDVKLVEEETLDGVRVRHFRGTTDIGRAAKAASPGSRGALRAAAKGFVVTEVPFDVYLDEQGRLRKVRQRFTFSDAAGGGQSAPKSVTVTSATRLYDFGAPVRIGLPDASDIYVGKIVSLPPPRTP